MSEAKLSAGKGVNTKTGVKTGTGDGDLSREIVLDVLSNERRRYVVHELKRRRDGTVRIGELAERVAGLELDKPVERLSYKERKRVKNALRQFHLPKMDDAGFVEFDEQSGTVELSDAAARQDFYVDVLPKRGIPWGVYYLGMSALGLAVFAAIRFGVEPFAGAPYSWSVAFLTVLTVSSVGHFYDNYYRMRLGARKRPPGDGP